MNIIKEIYNTLLEIHGPQGWWPVTPINSLYPKYKIKTKKTNKQKLEIIFGAILTQNTQWKPNVETAIINLNKSNLIDIKKILQTDHKIIANKIQSSGYFNQKTKKLKNIAEFLNQNPISKLEKLNLWQTRELLLSINGIGPETADSILLYALEKPIFVVDAYTKRIFSNLKIINKDFSYEKIQQIFMKNLDKKTQIFNEYHALIVAHAKKHYKKKSEYNSCPLFLKFTNKIFN
jgi:endonuclease III related protein